jgi:hypothetical protein
MPVLAPALLLLPGLLVVRAPWLVVAPLSVSFWVLSAWWAPPGGRGRFVSAALLASLLLALLRLLPKHEVPPPPGYRPPPAPEPKAPPGHPPPPLASAPALLVAAVATALLAPLLRFDHAPGARLAFHTTAARLVVWRDGIPAGFEPLLPLEPFGAHAPALATLAADLAFLSGADPAPAVAAVLAASAGLALVGLFGLLSTWSSASAAALAAVVGLAVPPWPGFLAAFGAAETLLALGLGLPAASLLAGRASRSSAAAAGFLLAAGALAQPLVAAAVGGGAAVVSLRVGSFPGRASRALAALALALLLAAPGLLPLARALSSSEALALARSVEAGELAAFASFPLATAAALVAFTRFGPPGRGRGRAARAAAFTAAGLLLGVRLAGFFRSGTLDEDTRARLAEAAARGYWLTAVCVREGASHFVPALAGRRAGGEKLHVPPVYSEEWTREPAPACELDLRAGPTGR